MRTLVAVSLLCSAVAAPAAAAPPRSPPEFEVMPTPSWVEPHALPPAPSPAAGEPVRELLVDNQYDLTTRVHYVRTARAVASITGIDAISEVAISFDPTYERLVLHGLRIWREGRARDAMATATSRTFYAESDRENRIYDGEKTALFVLKDVRVGDIVDLEFSRIGDNPVFDGFFSSTVPLAGPLSTGERHLRFLAAPDRAPHATALSGAPEARVSHLSDGKIELRWDARNVVAVGDDAETPSSYRPTPRVTVSDFARWEEVAAWARPLFEREQVQDPTLDALVARFRDEHPESRDARALSAIRFVQDEIRYLGMEMGAHSFRPHRPKDVLAGRFGDCKDKASLLVALLRGLGEDASVALVNTRARRELSSFAPNAGAFDHAIVAIERPDGRRWVDATQSLQGGAFTALVGPNFGWALLLRPGEAGIVPQEAQPASAPTFVMSELYRRAGDTSDAEWLIETRYREGDADDERRALARRTHESLTRSLLERRAADHDEVEIAAPLAVVDRRDENEIVMTETYRLPGYLKGPSFPFRAGAMRGVVPRPGPLPRTAPLALRYPYYARHTLAFNLGRAVEGLPHASSVETNDFAFRVERPQHGDVVHFELRTKHDAIPSARLPALAEDARHLDALTAGNCRLGRSARSGAGVVFVLSGLGGFLLFVVVSVAAVYRGRGKRKRSWRKKLRISGGETPTTALASPSEWHARAHAAARACGCGRKGAESVELSPLRLGDEIVTSVAVACACGAVNRTYYRIAIVATGVEE